MSKEQKAAKCAAAEVRREITVTKGGGVTRKFVVLTHVGKFETCAISPEKAIANVRFRIFGNRGYVPTYSWEAKEVA